MQGECNHTGDEEEEYGQQLQIGAEDGTTTGFRLVLTREYTLNDILVRTPVPETDDGRTDQGTQPGILWVAVGTHQVDHRTCGTFVIRLHIAESQHLIPTAEGLHTQNEDDQ